MLIYVLICKFTSNQIFTHLPSAAGPRAEDLPLLWQEGTAQQRAFAVGTAKTFFSCVPVLPIICHLALVNTFCKMGKNINAISECDQTDLL